MSDGTLPNVLCYCLITLFYHYILVSHGSTFSPFSRSWDLTPQGSWCSELFVPLLNTHSVAECLKMILWNTVVFLVLNSAPMFRSWTTEQFMCCGLSKVM